MDRYENPRAGDRQADRRQSDRPRTVPAIPRRSVPPKREIKARGDSAAGELIRILLCFCLIVGALLLKDSGETQITSAVSSQINKGADVRAFLSDLGKMITDREAWARLFGFGSEAKQVDGPDADGSAPPSANDPESSDGAQSTSRQSGAGQSAVPPDAP